MSAAVATSQRAPAKANVVVDTQLIAGRHVLMMRRRPASIAGAVIFPVMFTLLFFTLFQKVMERVGIDYAQHLVPAVVVQAMFFTGMSSAVIAAEESAGGMLSRLRSMPVSSFAPGLGLLVAELCRAVLSLAVLLPLGYALGFRFQSGVGGALGFVLVALGAVAVLCTGYIALGLKAGRPEAAQALVILPYFPLLLMSNALTPTEAFPSWLQPVVRNQPVSQVCDALRALSTDGISATRPVLEALAWLVPLFVLFAVAAARGFRGTR